MEPEANLDLDVDTKEGGARVKVGAVWAFTRHDGAPVITRECASYTELDREIARLESELESVRRRGAGHFEGKKSVEKPEAAARPKGDSKTASARMTSLLDILHGGRVRDLMTSKVQTVAPNDRLSIAEEMMRSGRFRHLVVCEDGEIVGVVSQRDIVLAGITWAMGIGKAAHEKALETCAVKEVMAVKVATVDPDAPLQEAAMLMTSRKIGCLPVVAGGKLEGILTEGDFVAMISSQNR